MIRDTVGREPYFIGKPNGNCGSVCRAVPGIFGRVPCCRGPALHDIACGINAGMEYGGLSYTGEADEEEVRTSIWKPDYCFDTIRDLYEAV